MPLDFSGQSLVGRSFKGEDLTGANFAFADIRSVNFTQANLSGANFYHARAGLSKPWHAFQILAMLACSAAVGLMSVIAGAFNATFLVRENIGQFTLVPGLLCLVAFAFITLPLILQGFTPKAFQVVVATSTLAVIGVSVSTLGATLTGSSDSAGGTVAGVVLLVVNSVLLTIAGAVGGRRLIGFYACFSAAIAALTYPITYIATIRSVAAGTPGLLNRLVILVVIAEILIAGAYVARQVLAGDERFALVHKIATAFTTIGGTCFHGANLTRADFTQATLPCTCFSNATLKHTRFYQAQQLNSAHLVHTILAHPRVRQLATTYNGHGQTYEGLNLQGIHLTKAVLSAANFTGSNLNHALLNESLLERANLSQVSAVGTSFQAAQLTGSCLDAWNIDSTTRLDDVSCDYVYLRQQQQERRPSSGLFQPGEFAKLFQEIIDTVDLIFQGGIDWQALREVLDAASSQQSTAQQPLTIRSIENKDDGLFVVRVDTPTGADKESLHQQLTEQYQQALNRLETTYQAQLRAKEEQVEMYKQHQADLSAIAQSLASCPVTLPNPTYALFNKPASKLVTLKFSAAQPTANSPILTTLQIGHEGQLPFLEKVGTLPAIDRLCEQYQQWQTSYRHLIQFNSSRIHCSPTQVTNISIQSIQQQLQQHTATIHRSFNQWLSAEEFRPLRENILENLAPTETVRIVISTDNPQIWQLPWQHWSLLEHYPNAEITFGSHQYTQQAPYLRRPCLSEETSRKTKILCVLGDSQGIEINTDCQLLKQLPNTQVTVLTEPTRQTLNDHLWEQSWNILCFAGHSNTQAGQGYLRLNATDTLSLSDISHALRRARNGGLQLAIFNSCDGLGLAQNLSHLCLPHMIVMREPVPDLVAHAFLKGFLNAFASGQPLPQAVRDAREKLQGLEDRFPCATWLPILCQTAATAPLTWQQLSPMPVGKELSENLERDLSANL
ncbi:MAG: pentapeptide repeat-containing protein [Phormidesmis sp.]